MKSKIIYQRLALGCLLLLIVSYFIYGLTRDPEQKALMLLLFALPLTIPIKGTLLARDYTFGYSSLLSAWYFLLSSSLALLNEGGILYLMMFATLLSLVWFLACLMHNKKPN